MESGGVLVIAYGGTYIGYIAEVSVAITSE